MQMPVRKSFSFARLGARAVLWMLASSLGAVALGQDATTDVPDDSDTPDEIAPERVARLSYTQGSVSLQGVGETAWAPATLNRPMTPGDFLRTESDGRAEVQVGTADVRMGAGTSFGFTTLDNDAVRVRVGVGVLNVRVRTLGENETFEIETPQATAAILRPGSYRLEVNPDGNATVVKVGSGMLEARGSQDQSFVVRAQQVATLTGTGRLAYATATLGAPDAFDEWALERDRRDDYVLSTEPAQNVPAEDIVGYEDLDKYGTWRSEPDYGYVWTPSYVAAGWAPYQFGRYTYVSGWGWAWIDDAPWGFAPYHYGRWVTIGSRWCWVPGPRHGRPVGRPGGTIIRTPSGPRDHGWHVPRPPRGGITVQNHGGRFGTRVDSRDSERSVITNPSGSPLAPGSRVEPRTRLDDSRLRSPRYQVPRNPRTDAGAGSRVGSYTPRPTVPSAVEQPRRNGPRFTTGGSIPAQSRPVTPPPRPVVSQPRPVVSSPRPVVSQPRPMPSRPVQAAPRPAPSAAAPRVSGPRPAATRER
jgi:hypothetical protein